MTTPQFTIAAGAGDTPVQRAAYWFLFVGQALLVQTTQDDEASVLFVANEAALPLVPVRRQLFGYLDGVPCYSAEIAPDTPPPAGMQFVHLRKLYGQLNEAVFWAAARAVQIVAWNRTHQFCGQCGTQTVSDTKEHVKVCPQCALRSYPRLSPAVIMSVTDGDKLLLAANVRYRNEMYSVLAGFVEPGETLEQTVIREVKEEVGIDVTNVRYFGSQPWPFPHSLMIGFTAEYCGGDIVVQEDEIRDAAWFSADDLPVTPARPSIAYDLIAAFVQQQEK